MSTVEIVVIVILCLVGISNILLWCQTSLLIDRFLVKCREEDKKSIKKNEEDTDLKAS